MMAKLGFWLVMRKHLTWVGVFLGFVTVAALGRESVEAAHKRRGVVVQCEASCDRMISALRDMGVEITHRYENVDGFAAAVPANKLMDVMAVAGPDRVVKDVVVEPPRPVRDRRTWREQVASVPELPAEGSQVLDAAGLPESLAALPANYNLNNSLTGAAVLHAQGKLGQNVVVAVIDSGTANTAVVPALAGSVIGGESFVPGDPVTSATSRLNDPHGTWVGSMIAAHANFVFSATSRLVQSLQLYASDSVISCPGPPFVAPCAPGRYVVPMIGTAPGAKLYPLKVFSSAGGGAPQSRILAAMDRAITLRRNFNRGLPSVAVSGNGTENAPYVFDSLKIDVVNMSLGGPTLFAGRDLEDLLTLKMLREGITLVTSAGNDGFAAMTGAGPGTGLGSLTVGAASTAPHERVLRELQLHALFPLGIGAAYRPTDHVQTADFSARGPTADGRFDPEVISNGLASYAQGANGSLALVSGTSFSGPTVAGAAALLRREAPTATAAQIRNALIQSANPRRVGDRSRRIDQGRGFIDLPAALELLQSDRAVHGLSFGLGTPSVLVNAMALGFRPVVFVQDRFHARVENLRPGQVAHFFVPSRDKTERFVVKLRNVTPELPPGQQNQLFGDDLFVTVVDAPTSFARTRFLEFVDAEADFEVDDPQEGLVRVAVQGDSTNAGRISADLIIERERAPLGPPTAAGKLRQGDLVPIEVDVPAGTQDVVFEAFCREDWGHYPTNDHDMILVDPNGGVNFDGATLDSPERVAIENPVPGRWIVFLQGFTIHARQAHFTLRATADGVRLVRAR